MFKLTITLCDGTRIVRVFPTVCERDRAIAEIAADEAGDVDAVEVSRVA